MDKPQNELFILGSETVAGMLKHLYVMQSVLNDGSLPKRKKARIQKNNDDLFEKLMSLKTAPVAKGKCDRRLKVKSPIEI